MKIIYKLLPAMRRTGIIMSLLFTFSNAFCGIDINAITPESAPGASDGAVDLLVEDVALPITFQWSNGATTEDINGLVAGLYSVTVTYGGGICEVVLYANVESCSELILVGIQHNGFIRCSGGTGTFTASTLEGQPPYTFAWNNGATTQTNSNIPAGLYCVTVTDAEGCSDNMCLTMTEPDPIVITGTAVFGTCLEGGSITLNVSGGTPPYTYFWDDDYMGKDREDLEEGQYCVQVIDRNGCEAEKKCFIIKVSEFLGIQLDELSNSSDCLEGNCNGAINISVPNSNGAATYSWIGPGFLSNSEDISGLCPGTYTVTASYGGCTGTKTFDICCCNFTMQEPHEPTNNEHWCGTEGEEPLIISGVVTPIFISGNDDGMIDITVSGGSSADYTYSWTSTDPSGFTSNAEDISNLAPNRYCVTVRDGCHRVERCFDVVDCEKEDLEIYAIGGNTCFGYQVGWISASGVNGQPPYSFEWNTGQNGSSIADLGADVYCVTVTDGHGCTANTCFLISSMMTTPALSSDPCGVYTMCGNIPVDFNPSTIDCYYTDCIYEQCDCSATGETIIGPINHGYSNVHVDINNCNLVGNCLPQLGFQEVVISYGYTQNSTVASAGFGCSGFCTTKKECVIPGYGTLVIFESTSPAALITIGPCENNGILKMVSCSGATNFPTICCPIAVPPSSPIGHTEFEQEVETYFFIPIENEVNFTEEDKQIINSLSENVLVIYESNISNDLIDSPVAFLENNNVVEKGQISVYPNPFQDIINIEMVSNEDGEIMVTLLDSYLCKSAKEVTLQYKRNKKLVNRN